MRTWLTALRLARRELRRSTGRSLLVVALIGLPVLVFTTVAATYDTFTLTPAERADRTMGRADLLIREVRSGPIKQRPAEPEINDGTGEFRDVTAADVTAMLPAGSRVIPLGEGDLEVRTAGGRSTLPVRLVDYADPIAAGVLVPLSGRAPAGAGEVAVSPAAAGRLGVTVGGSVSTPDGRTSARVVGLVENPDDVDGLLLVLHPDAAAAVRATGPVEWLADTPAPMRWDGVRELNRQGVAVLSRAVLLDPPPFDPATMMPADRLEAAEVERFAAGTVLGGLLVLEVVLLAGPAFAVGARRRRRELALVAAAGAHPAQLRRIVLADGVLLGSLAAVGGIGLGVLAATALRGAVTEYVMHSRPGGWRVFPLALAGLAGLAVGSGLVAALVPAWTAARQPVVRALAGQFAPSRPRRWWAVGGALVIAVGVAGTAYAARRADPKLATATMVLGVLGLVLCTPTLLGLIARFGGPLPLGVRIALRDVGRNRAAAAPAVSAVLAAVAVCTLAGSVSAGNTARNDRSQLASQTRVGHVAVESGTSRHSDSSVVPPPPPSAGGFAAIEAAARATLPVAAVVPVGEPVCPAATVAALSAGGVAYGDPVLPPGTVMYCGLRYERPAAQECPFERRPGLSRADQRAAYRDPRCGSGRRGGPGHGFGVAVIDPADLGTLATLDPQVRTRMEDVLRSGGVLIEDPLAVEDGQTTVVAADQSRVRVPAMAVPVDVDGPDRILSPATAQRLGMTYGQVGFVIATSRMPTVAEEDAFREATAGIDGGWRIEVNRPVPVGPDLILLLLTVAAGVVTVGAAVIAAGLAAAESRDDLVTLAAVGAPPRIRRALTLSRTGVVAGLGSTLGLLAGLGAALAVVTGTNAGLRDVWPIGERPLPFLVSWPLVGVAVVVAPVLAMLGAALFTRARLPAERRAVT